MKRNTVNINSDVYKKLQKYCELRGIKINWFIEKIILDTIIKNEI